MSITSLKPELLWKYFHELCQIPRPSGQEEAVQNYVLGVAKELGLWAERDAGGNVLIRKPASKGKENAPGVILQAHLDMVAQKTKESKHDFSKDPIEAYIDGEWVRAKDTTLGADNGIGAATALAVLADNSIEHGPIEALFTATEETAMDGAFALKGGWLKGSLLLNLDTEDLGEICIGCAGGVDGTFTLPLTYETNNQAGYTLAVYGLMGGHSGSDIIKQRGNANKILARLLSVLGDKIRIHSMQGGTLRNAIPRDAEAVITSAESMKALQAALEPEIAVIRRGLPEAERNAFGVKLTEADKPAKCWNKATQDTVLRTINVCPNGVDRMSIDIAGLVETSSNLASIRTNDQEVQVQCLLRSSDNDARDNLGQRMLGLFLLAGGNGKLDNDYPGWQPIVGAKITDVLVQEGEKVIGKKPIVNVIHAGLECGILAQNYPHWQMASIGPDIVMPHSPDERVNIKSVEVFWKWLLAVLKAL